MASGPVGRASSGYSVPALCTAFGFFLLLCGLCAFCKKRNKRRMRNICLNRAPVVDVSLLRQTQLRSLSKSDTKLHEIKRPHSRNSQLRPVSMNPEWMWQRTPGTPPTNATYSNLSYTSKTQESALYESVAVRSELEDSEGPPSMKVVADEYACVRKLKKAENTPTFSPVPTPCPTNRPDGLMIEDMYSKVNKKMRSEDKRNGMTLDIQGVNAKSSPASSQGVLVMQPEENLYESICEMSSHDPGSCDTKEVITEL